MPAKFIPLNHVVNVTVNVAAVKTVTRPGIERVTQNKTDTFQQDFVTSYKITCPHNAAEGFRIYTTPNGWPTNSFLIEWDQPAAPQYMVILEDHRCRREDQYERELHDPHMQSIQTR